MFLDDHHGDGRLAIWCAAPDGVQADLVETEPERFFRPPYVGHLGWLGIQLPGLEDAELHAICQEAFTTVAPRSVLKIWRSQPPDRLPRSPHPWALLSAIQRWNCDGKR